MESISHCSRLVEYPIGRKFVDSEACWIVSRGQTVKGAVNKAESYENSRGPRAQERKARDRKQGHSQKTNVNPIRLGKDQGSPVREIE